MTEGVDYSFARPGGAVLAAAGKRFAGRYLWPDGKGLTAVEAADLNAHGIAIFAIFEGSALGVRGGRAQGVADAQAARSYLIPASLPATTVVYFAADFDAQSPTDLALIDEYLDGAASVIGRNRVGIYGGFHVIVHVQATHTAAWFFQTYAWSGGQVAPGIHLLQYSNSEMGGQVDFVRSYQADFGQAGITRSGTTSPASVGPTVAIRNTLTNGEDMEIIVVIADLPAAKKQNPKLYGSTAVITAHRGFVKTSAGLGPRNELNAWTAVAGALGIPATVKHVDANGYLLAQRF